MIGVVADDLTGAAEIGALGWRKGLKSLVVLRGGEVGTADLVCLDTDSRGCTAAEAARRSAAAAEQLMRAGATCVFKKTDSLLRGQVTAEIEAVMTVLGLRRTLLLPMNPSRGRTIEGGKYLVHGVPINETEFARDPGYPRSSAFVLDLIQPSSGATYYSQAGPSSCDSFPLTPAHSPGEREKPMTATSPVEPDPQEELSKDPPSPRVEDRSEKESGARLPDKPRATEMPLLPSAVRIIVLRPSDVMPAEGIVVGEAASSDQVMKWARQRDGNTLAAGGAEFFEATLETLNLRGSLATQIPRNELGGTLFVCGSASNACRLFVNAAKSGGTPVYSLPQGLASGGELRVAEVAKLASDVVAALEARHRVVLAVGLPLVKDRARSARFATSLVRVAVEILREAPVDEVYAEGGATAVELAVQMGWSSMEVVGEICPGVVALQRESERPRQFIVKPGSYAWPDAVVNSLQMR